MTRISNRGSGQVVKEYYRGENSQSQSPDNQTRDEKNIYNYIRRMDFRQLKNHLEYLVKGKNLQGGIGQTGSTCQILDITLIFNNKGFTPLHFAAF